MDYPYTLIMLLFVIPGFFTVAGCWAFKNLNATIKIQKQSILKTIGFLLSSVFSLYLSFTAGNIVVQKLTEILKEYFTNTEEPLSQFAKIIMLFSISLSIFVALEILCFKKIYHPNKTEYNSEYISKLMMSESLRAPAVTRQQLMQKITGGRATTCDIKKAKEMTDSNIRPIKRFLASKKSTSDNVLIINSRWGSGKTTSILIAINESAKINNYYIYESAFKYHGNLDEFTKDILETLKNIMAKMNIRTESLFRDLAVNLDSNIYKTFANFIANKNSSAMLTSEIIYQINKKYSDAKLQERIVLVVDDMDRLLGHDILEILSLLSVLRRLKFIKIILPVDLAVVNEALRNEKVVEPDRFIEKYLPEQQAIKINSGYDIVKDIAEGKIRHAQKVFDRNRNFNPAFAAILFKVYSIKLTSEAKNYHGKDFNWLFKNDFSLNKLPDNISRTAKVIYSATRYVNLNPRPNLDIIDFEGSIEWSASRGINHFEDIILCLKSRKRGRIAKSFSKEDYEDYVASWLFAFAENSWDVVGITLRDVLDVAREVAQAEMPDNPAKQFTEVFNCLFPKTPIDHIE